MRTDSKSDRREYYREYYKEHRYTWNIPAWMLKLPPKPSKPQPPENESKEEKLNRLLVQAVYLRRAVILRQAPRAEHLLGWDFTEEEVRRRHQVEREALRYMLERTPRISTNDAIRYTHIPRSIIFQVFKILDKVVTLEALDELVAMVRAKEREEIERLKKEHEQRREAANAN